jgi:hypothetical protein
MEDHPRQRLSSLQVSLRVRPGVEGMGPHPCPEVPPPMVGLAPIDRRLAPEEGWAGASRERLCLKARAKKPSGDVTPVPVRGEAGDEGRFLACARCRRAVTTAAARIEVAGGHEHRFVNPAGIHYHIGCFARAAGLIPVGGPSPYWTWFPAYRWQIEHCPAAKSTWAGFSADPMTSSMGSSSTASRK